jgi:hypothetical protein
MLVGYMAGIQDRPMNPGNPMLTTHANPKAGRDVNARTPSRRAPYKPAGAASILFRV